MAQNIYVTGLGIYSSIGKNVAEALDSLKQGKSGIGEIEYLETVHRGEIPVCEIKESNEALMAEMGFPENTKTTRTTLIAMLAAREALNDAGIEHCADDNIRTGIISATTVGGMDVTEQYYFDFMDWDKTGDFLQLIDKHDCGASTEDMADLFGIRDYNATISTACSSSANSLMLGARLIQQGVIDRALVGGTDALSKFTLNGFNSLKILDRAHCRPFDNTREGLNLGEGAGFVILESEALVKEQNKTPYCKLSGFANTNDAFHQTASSPEGNGAWMAMKDSLEMAGLSPKDISYINVHGTGTGNNDLSEGVAMKRLFGENLPPFSSTKALTGHTLGAAGGIEAVFSALSIKHQLIYPNLNFKNPIEDIQISPVTKLIADRKIDHVLSNSFGFGGNNSTLIFSRI